MKQTWHDDANGPSCLTCWQNFGVADGSNLQLIVAIHGCHVRVNAGIGKIVHFMAWLPHCTESNALLEIDRNNSVQSRLHDTAYAKMGTEYAGIILTEYEKRNLRLDLRVTK